MLSIDSYVLYVWSVNMFVATPVTNYGVEVRWKCNVIKFSEQ